jgi:exopolyphosphatase / guanosine-5'-triphosphate,3'-diphosphate pyrophosphatase
VTKADLRGVIDVGSNTIRMLVGRAASGKVEPVLDRSEFVRLGAGVDKNGKLEPDRQQAAIDAISSLTRQAHEIGVRNIVAIATSAVRDAANRTAFKDRVRDETGVELEIISGNREACLTFLGVTAGLDLGMATIVCDLGGGSAELICANSSGVEWSTSLPLGSGRLTERFVHNDPPGPAELHELRGFVKIEIASLYCSDTPKLVFTGGTATHVATMSGSTNSVTELALATLRQVVESLTSAESLKIATKYGFREERAKVLPAGAAALLAIAEHFRAEGILVTRQGIREGVLLEE